MGLLGEDIDPKTQGLLALGFGLLNSRGNLGQAIGQAGPQAMQAYSQANDAIQRKKQQEQAMQAQALQMQMSQQQMAELQRQAQDRDRLSALAAASVITPQQGAMAANGGPTTAAAGAIGNTRPGFDWAKYATSLAGVNPMMALQVQTAMKKEQPKLSKLEAMRGADGKMVNVAVFEDGTTKVLPYGVRPDIALQSLGDQVVAIDKNETPGGAAFRMGATPDARLQVGATIRGQDSVANTAANRLAFDRESSGGSEYKQDANGDWMALPKKPQPGQPIVPTPVSAPNKNIKSARDALGIIDQARDLLDKSTNSYIGTGVDMAGQLIGASTSGAQAAAKLKALEGALMLRQPRMEGPQSNNDVALYRQMAAQIGDSTVPVATRKAALDTIQELHERYAGITKPPKTQTVKPGSTLRFDSNGMMVVE